MKDEKKEASKFIRTLMIVLSSFIIWIITYSFLNSTPKGEISSGVVTLIIILVIIILSESFDNFSLGKIFSLSKDNEVKDKSLDGLKSENTELRKEVFNLVTSISQTQSNNNYFGLSDNMIKQIGIEQATKDEIEKKRNEENEDDTQVIPTVRKRLNHRKIEEFTISQFLSTKNLSKYNLVKEAKLVTQFSGIDPISNIQPIYDGYINTGESEIFIEVKTNRGSILMMRERIYMMLNKIYLYNKIKNANAHLNLLIVEIDNDDSEPIRNQRQIDKIKEYFEPSIIKGLLNIIPIKLSKQEQNQIIVTE